MAELVEHHFRLAGPDGERVLVAPEGATTIGRQADGDWQLSHQLISRRHASLECAGEICQIMDLDSANGTFVNGIKLAPQEPQELQPGDKIGIGKYTLVYEPVAVAVSEPAEPPPIVEEVQEPAETSPPTIQRQILAPAVPSPPEPPSIAPVPANGHRPELPPGLDYEHSQYLDYLPGIYHTPFMAQLLALFESILGPIEWTVDNFDLFLSPGTAPESFLPWLANLFALTFDDTWNQAQRRILLTEAVDLFASRGTGWALARLLEIYLERAVEIDDQHESLDPFTFTVKLPVKQREIDESLIQRLIDAHKPAHTAYQLEYA